MGKIIEKMFDRPIRSAILISAVLGGVAEIIEQIKKLK